MLQDAVDGKESIYEVRWQTKDGGVIHVDVYDALRSHRPYRESWPDEKARAYLHEQAGRHFDPKVVDVFLQLENK